MIKVNDTVYLSRGATNIRSWHGADRLKRREVYYERKAEVGMYILKSSSFELYFSPEVRRSRQNDERHLRVITAKKPFAKKGINLI